MGSFYVMVENDGEEDASKERKRDTHAHTHMLLQSLFVALKIATSFLFTNAPVFLSGFTRVDSAPFL